MKKIFYAIILIFAFIIAPIFADTYQHNYSQICKVYKVNDTETIFIDPVGYLWSVNDTNYTEGETVKVYFHDSFTDFNREDDEITKIKRVD